MFVEKIVLVVLADGCLDVNTEIENLKNAVVKVCFVPLSLRNSQRLERLIILHQSLKAGQPVFFGCDVGQFSEGSSGIMDTELFEYEVGNHSSPAVSRIVIIYDP